MKRIFLCTTAALAFSCYETIAQLEAAPSSLSAGSAPPNAGITATVNQPGTNQFAISPEIQRMLVTMQLNVEQLLPALAAFNSGAQLSAIGAVTPPAPATSGENLGRLLTTNMSVHAGVNSSVNLSQPAGAPAPNAAVTPNVAATPDVAAVVPPAVGAPPTATGAQNPYTGYAGTAALPQQLAMLQIELERLLPILASINNQVHLSGGSVNSQSAAEGFDALGRRLVNPLTNESVTPLTNRFAAPLTNTFVTPLTNFNPSQPLPPQPQSPF